MQRSTIFNIVTLAIAGFLFVSSVQKQALAQNLKFEGITAFTTTGGMMGFFDQKDGMLYLYEPDLTKCVLIVQLTALGEPLAKIK